MHHTYMRDQDAISVEVSTGRATALQGVPLRGTETESHGDFLGRVAASLQVVQPKRAKTTSRGLARTTREMHLLPSARAMLAL